MARPQVQEECPKRSFSEVGPNKMFYCYLLRLKNGKEYVGFSSDLKTRLDEHKSGKVFATKRFLPFKLTYYSAFVSKKKALDFEKYLKTASGFAFRNKRLV